MIKKKICVVGGGYWGKNHIKTLNKLNALAGIVEFNQTLASDYSFQYPDVKIYSSIDDALESKIFDGYTIATPSETHYEIAKHIIAFRKPLLVEKPLALKITDAEELVTMAKKNSVTLMVGHLLLFHPAIKKIKELIDQNKIGKVMYLYSNRLNFGKVRTHENVLQSLATHDIAIFQYLVNEYPVSIVSRGSSFLQSNIDDFSTLHLKYEKGVCGHIFASWLNPFKEHKLVIIGSNGMITYNDSHEDKPLMLFDKNFTIKNGEPLITDNGFSSVSFENKLPLEEEMKHFLSHLEKSAAPLSNGQSALEVVRILNATH